MPASASSKRWPACSRSPGRYASVLERVPSLSRHGLRGPLPRRSRPQRRRRGVRRIWRAHLAELGGTAGADVVTPLAGRRDGGQAPATLVPPWVIGTATAALLLVLFTGFRYRLADYSRAIGTAGREPARAAGAVLQRPRERHCRPIAARSRTVLDPGFLAEEQLRGLVTVEERPQRVLIRLTARGPVRARAATSSPRNRAIWSGASARRWPTGPAGSW